MAALDVALWRTQVEAAAAKAKGEGAGGADVAARFLDGRVVYMDEGAAAYVATAGGAAALMKAGALAGRDLDTDDEEAEADVAFDDAPLTLMIARPLDAATLRAMRRLIQTKHPRTRRVALLLGFGEAAHAALSERATPLGDEAVDEVAHAFRDALDDEVDVEAAYLPMSVGTWAAGHVSAVWHPHLACNPPLADCNNDDDAAAIRGHALACLLDQLHVKAEFFAVTPATQEDGDNDAALVVAQAAATAVRTTPSRRRADAEPSGDDRALPRCSVLVVDRRMDWVTPLACAAWSAADRALARPAAPAPAACAPDAGAATIAADVANAIDAAAAGRSAASAPTVARTALRSEVHARHSATPPRGDDDALVNAFCAALAPGAEDATRSASFSPIASRFARAKGQPASATTDWAWYDDEVASMMRSAAEGAWPAGGAAAALASVLPSASQSPRITPVALLSLLAFALDAPAASRREAFAVALDDEDGGAAAAAALQETVAAHGDALDRAMDLAGVTVPPDVEGSAADRVHARLRSVRALGARHADPLPRYGIGGGTAQSGEPFPCRHRSLVRTLVAYADAPSAEAASSALGDRVRVTHVPRGDAAGFAGATLRQGLALGLGSLLKTVEAARPLGGSDKQPASTADALLPSAPHPRDAPLVLLWFVHGGASLAEAREAALLSPGRFLVGGELSVRVGGASSLAQPASPFALNT